ncbi:hypothetical protein STRUR_0061 [Streptococcus urinalis 2285-97]|uniref:DUF1304 domain-containing protein n=2 Tax=Streptococcus urinalis TaxID=149016 RepID=G5KGN9_9STRE|nr:hypothetical protein STRUR_0061 [Streptococcus urinalis 2285-97]
MTSIIIIGKERRVLMSFITIVLVLLVALEFIYIMYLETIATSSEKTSQIFGMSKEELQRESVQNLFKNQGIYNLLFALGLLYGLMTNHSDIIIMLLIGIILVAIYGAITVNKKIVIQQAGLAVLALISFFF